MFPEKVEVIKGCEIIQLNQLRYELMIDHWIWMRGGDDGVWYYFELRKAKPDWSWLERECRGI